jgi:O-antigen/teichoic acid export membrane protein
MLNSWLKKSLALYSANGLNFLLNILIIPIVVFFIGFDGYGFYSVYIILSSTLLFLDSALSKSVVSSAFSASNQQRAQLISSSRATYLATGLLLLLATPLVAQGVSLLFPLRTEQLDLAYWIGAAALIEYVMALPGQYFQMLNVLRGRHYAYAQYQLCIQLSRFFTVAVVAASTQQIEWVLAAIVLRKIPDYLILWLFWRNQPTEPSDHVAWPFVGALLRQSAPIVGVALLQVLATEFISIYISHAYGAETLGKYRSVYDVLNKIWFVATLYPVLVYPKICQWLADEQKRTWLQGMLPRINLGSALVYATLTIAGLAVYPLLASWFPPLQAAAPFAAGLLAGICMSGHVRLGYEFLQAQKDANTALLINLLSLATGAIILYAFQGNGTREIGWAWLAAQLLAVAVVDLRNGALLATPWRKSLMGLLPWLGVGIGVFAASSIHGTPGAVFLLLLLAVSTSCLAIHAKRLRVSGKV